MLVSPSLLAADFLNLGSSLKLVRNADFIHLDVMDGTFVPNISFGFSVIDAISGKTELPMDVHLMTVHPERWFKRLKDVGASMVSFHLETAGDESSDLIAQIQALGMKAGLAINPDVPVDELFPYIGQADFFLVMSVFAGFGGQKFMPESIGRVRTLKEEITRLGCNALIVVDGGVSSANVNSLGSAGTDIVVAGSSVFKADDPWAAINALKQS